MRLEVLDWVDALGVRGDELRATWARFRLSGDDWCATRVVSGVAGGARDHVYVSVYPLAEWFAANWWFLESEFKTPRSGYGERHSLRFAGDGSAYPSLAIFPLGDLTEVSFQKRALQHQKLEFIAEGTVYERTQDVMRSIARFIEYVLERLEDCEIHSSALHEEWQALRRSQEDPEERSFCRLSATLGEDPYDIGDRIANSLERWSEKVRQDVFGEICAALTTSTFETGIKWIDKVAAELSLAESPWIKLAKIKKAMDLKPLAPVEAAIQPWAAGYKDAKKLRKQMGLNGQLFGTTEELLEVFRPAGDMSAAVPYSKGVAAFDGVVRCGKNGVPAFLVTKKLDSAKRFAFMRSVYDYLQIREGDLAVATRSHSQLQQASRAFAAEFLAPSSLLRKEISAEYVGWDEISNLAEAFGVSERAIEHQIVNHRLAKIIDSGLPKELT